MKITQLSLIATLALSTAFAGGDVIPPEVIIVPVVENPTTVAGKLQAYYFTDSNTDLFDELSSNLGTTVTLDVSHKFFDGLSANFSAVGYSNIMEKGTTSGITRFFEGTSTGAYMNVANLTLSYADTTLVAGRQLLDTPMLGGFDWLLAPGAFEAYTLVNNSISNLTLVGSYVTKWRGNNTGDTFTDLTVNSQDNYAVGAVYANESLFDSSVWYYNVDAAKYTQVYADAGVSFYGAKVQAQYVMTDYATGLDSSAYGAKLSYDAFGLGLYGAITSVTDINTGYIGRDSLYTSSWNRFASDIAVAGKDTLSWKAGATAEFYGMSAEASYAGYGDEGSELDVILGYDVSKSFALGAIYSLTDYDVATATTDAVNQVEVIATYKF